MDILWLVDLPADRIERFIRGNPSGELWVCVGYASAFGLAWLGRRTAGRPVRLLIGDTRTGFSKYKESDRREAVQFLRRPDVSVRNWYRVRGGRRMAHAKVWMVKPDPTAGISGVVLVGSANLTRQGLQHNVEVMSIAASSEHGRLFGEMDQLMNKSWPIEQELLETLAADKAPRAGLPADTHRRGQPIHDRRESNPETVTAVSTRSGNNAIHGQSGTRAVRRGRRPGVPRRSRRRSSRDPVWRGLATAAGTIIAGLAVLLALPKVIGLATGSSEVAGSSAATSEPPTAQVDSAPYTAQGTLAHPPKIATSPPPRGWSPEVGGNASSHGEPKRQDLQWVAWQPDCPSCEPGVTMTWVGSYAFPFNRGVGYTDELRPMLVSNCFHRDRRGPLIDWRQDFSDDQVEAVWIDGETAPPGQWWITDNSGNDPHVMVPEPAPFLALLEDAKQLRVMTVQGRDATFAVDGFLATPVQANLDHCGHYP